MMPSFARMRLATASSWRSSANESGIAGFLRSGNPVRLARLHAGYPRLDIACSAKDVDGGDNGVPADKVGGVPRPGHDEWKVWSSSLVVRTSAMRIRSG